MGFQPYQPLINADGAASKEPASYRGRLQHALEHFFQVSARGSTLVTECRAGTTAFLAMVNNFILTAQIMSHAGMSKHDVVVSSALVSGFANIMNGLLSNQPLGLATSVGPNVFVAYSLVGEGDFDANGALAVSLACGALLGIFSLTPILQIMLGLIPLSVKQGLIMGTGLLCAFIGVKSVGVVVADTNGNNIVALGELAGNTEVVISVALLILIASLIHRNVKGGVLIGMLFGTFLYWLVSGEWPTSYIQISTPHLHALDLNVLLSGQTWPQVLALFLMLLFSIQGAVIGCGRMAGLLKEDGDVAGTSAVYVTCGFATVLSAILGSSPVIVSTAAGAGIRDGGRTGIVSIVVGLLCIFTALFFSPLASMMPHCATAPVLLLVGVVMLGEAKEVRWWNIQEALPAFLCAILQPFTYSVSNGIYAGVGMSFVLFFTTGSFLESRTDPGRAHVKLQK